MHLMLDLERGFQLIDELLDALLLNSKLALLLLVDRLYRDKCTRVVRFNVTKMWGWTA